MARATNSLPVPVSPPDQHGGVALRHIDDGVEELEHRRRLAHQVFKAGDFRHPVLENQVSMASVCIWTSFSMVRLSSSSRRV